MTAIQELTGWLNTQKDSGGDFLGDVRRALVEGKPAYERTAYVQLQIAKDRWVKAEVRGEYPAGLQVLEDALGERIRARGPVRE
jgi:hypothetical protein